MNPVLVPLKRAALVGLVAVGMLFGVSPTSAQQAPNFDRAPQVIKIFNAIVSYPLPSWIKPPISLDQSEYYKDQQGPSFLLEQIPKGEKFESWSRLYAVHGTVIKNGQNITLDNYAFLNFGPLIKACGKENISLQRIHQSKHSQSFVVLCQDTPHAQPGSGYGQGVGEVGLFRFTKFKNTFIKIYQEWRGQSFDSTNNTTWPVSQEELKIMIRRFGYIKITPTPK